MLGKNIVFRFSDRIISNSLAGLRAYKAPPEKSNVIYNGFDFRRLQNLESISEIRDRFNIKTRFVVGMVASFLIYKDYETYLLAALKILNHRKDITFLCIGDGNDDDYKKMISENDRLNIMFLGRQSRVEEIMNVCDVGVLTTNVNHAAEGISNAAMEFMALGKPTIVTDCGGSEELIKENESGYLIDAFSKEQLIEKINYLIDNESERKRIGQNAMNRIRDKFSMQAMFSSFQEEYINVVKESL
jgi:glycosyltransferase involved in cell wall biosynthesis